VGDERALVVFDRRAAAQQFREDTGRYAGYGIVGVDDARIAALLARNSLRLIVKPELTEDGEWSFDTNFMGHRFLEILEAGIKE
jgi:hypothetical protein